jgi:hypothetical protein
MPSLLLFFGDARALRPAGVSYARECCVPDLGDDHRCMLASTVIAGTRFLSAASYVAC